MGFVERKSCEEKKNKGRGKVRQLKNKKEGKGGD